MDNVVPLAMHYTDDTWRRLLKEATSTFTFKVDMLGRESEQYLTDDAYISFKYNNRQYLFNVMTITPDSGSKSIIVYCENLSLELLNETKAPINVTTSRNLLWYLNNDGLLNNAGITLGINEVSDKTAKIKLESEQTGLARLTSIANNFDAEIEFVTELNGDGTLKSMTVNFFKKYDGVSQGVGTYRRDLILEYGRNVDGIKRTIDKTDLYNAITPNGKDGLNITSLEKDEYDENGNLEYYTKKGSPNIFAPQSKVRYRAQLLNDTDGWLRRNYSADGTSNVNTLYSLALSELKKHAYPAITYEVTGFYDLDIGDTVRIVDRSFTPTLIIQARVAEQSICFSDPTKNKTTFGNILALESLVSQDLTGRLKELVEQVTPYRFEIVSDNGLTFKNSTGSTTLTARVYKGSNVEEVSVGSFEWLLNGVSFGGTSKSQLVNASQVSGTAVVRYNAKIGDTVIGGLEVTIQDISDGANGISPTVKINPDTSLTIVDAQGTKTTPVLKGADGANGQDAISVVLSNENVTLPANAQGGVTSYANSGTTLSVFVGKTAWSYGTGANKWTVAWSASGATRGTGSNDGTVASFDNISGMSATSGATATQTFVISVDVGGTVTTFAKVQNISKSEKGITGDDGIDNFTYFRYSPYPDGKNMTSLPNADSKYLGIVVTTSAIAPSSYNSYAWSKYAGNDANKYGDNVIFNPKFENILIGKVNPGDMSGLGWDVNNPSYLLQPEADAPSEKIIHLDVNDTYLTSKGIPVIPGERYIFSVDIKTTNFGSGNTAPLAFRMYPSSNDSNSFSITGNISEVLVRINGASSGTNLVDVSNFPIVNNVSWNTRSYVFEIPENVAYIRPLLFHRGVAGDKTKYRKLELRKQQQSAVVKSATEPIYKYVGMQWQYTGESAITIGGIAIQPSTIYIWSGSVWQLHVIRSTNIQVDNAFITNAMIANAAIDNAKIKSVDADKVTAATLEALSAIIGKLKNTYSVDYGAGVHTGTVTIENGMKIVDDTGISRTTTDFTSQSSGQGMFAQHLPNKSDPTKYRQAWYTPFSLRFDDTVNGWHGQITAENVTLVPWTNLTYYAGYTTAEDNPCQYRKIKNLDGSYTVQFRGQVKPVSGSFPGTNSESNFQIIANLPVDIRPSRHTFLPAVGDMMGTQTIRIGALSDGRIQVGVRGTASSYIGINSLIYTI